MQLLGAKEIKEAQKVEMSKEVGLAQKVVDYSNKKRKELNQLKDYYASEKQKIKNNFAFTLEVHNKKYAGLIEEINNLETKKAELLKPVEPLIEKIKKQNQESNERKEVLDLKEQDLTIKEAALTTQKNKLVKDQENLNKTKKSIDNTRISVSEESTALKERQRLFSEEVAEKELFFAQQKSEILHERDTIKVQKAALDDREEHITQQENNVAVEKRKIKDQRETLERAFARIKKKK